MELSQMQKLACEGLWRAYREYGDNQFQLALKQSTPEPQARRVIADYVKTLPVYHLPNLIMPDWNLRGQVKNGYTRQWQGISEAGKRHDAHVAQQKSQRDNMRASECEMFAEVSDSSGSRSKDPTASEPSDLGQKDDPDKTPTTASDIKTGRTKGYIAQHKG